MRGCRRLNTFLDHVAHSLTIVGTLPDGQDTHKVVNAIIRVEKTALPAQQARTLVTHFLKDVQFMESNDIVRDWILQIALCN